MTADGSAAVASAQELAARDLSAIRGEFDRLPRQVSGYRLEYLLPEHGFDVPKALVGSEGTCAIVLRARVRLVAPPPHSVLVVLGYPDMASAADAVPALLAHRPIALEGIDRRIVEVVRSRRGPGTVPPLPAGGGWLLAELGGAEPGEARAAATRFVADAATAESLVVTEAGQARALWRIRADGAGWSARVPGRSPRHAGWEDAAVPPGRLGAYLRDFEDLLGEHGLDAIPYGHFGDGCLHTRIDFPLGRPDGTAAFRRFLEDAADLVARHGGSMSGEHGDGRARSELLPRMYSGRALAAFGTFKRAFDPDGLLNPGVITAPRPLDADLRPPAVPATRRLAFAYAEDGGDLGAAAHRCVGLGKCRSQTADGAVMCPSFMATGDEKDSTRGRARVLQEMAGGGLVTGGWRSPEVHDALDLCLACKGCLSDCPTQVDMATYKAEMLHQAYRGRLRPASHYALGWLPRWVRAARRAPAAVNGLLAARPVAAVAKRLAGVDRRRSLPRLAGRTFRQWFDARPPASGTGRPVLLWVDTFTDAFTPQVGVAAVRVLEDAGFTVRLSEPGRCCGLTWITTGQLGRARRELERSVAALAPHATAGTPIVGLEPSCTAVFRSDASGLLGPGRADVRETAAGVRTLAELLAAAPGWSPPSLQGVDAVAQPHCHQHAVLGWEADRALLEGAGARVHRVGGCCGMAGNFGYERGHYEVSAAVAAHDLLPALAEAADDAVLLADGFSCRSQAQDLAGRRGLHLAELLAERLGDGAESPPPAAG